MWFGQLVIGPPGAGKSTYCHGLHQILTGLGRKHLTLNLDPANDNLQFQYDIDIRDLVDVENIMSDLKLGPNGSLIFAMEYINKNFDWIEEKLKKYPNRYLIVDFPGQVELYTHYFTLRDIVGKFKKIDCQLCAVHLIDCTLCVDIPNYISAILVSLSGMMVLELPHINVLSKCDLLKLYADTLPFSLDTLAYAEDLSEIVEHSLPAETQPRLRKLQAVLAELASDYSLVSFLPLDVHRKESMLLILKAADTSNGFGIASETLKGNYEFAIQSHTQNLCAVFEAILEERDSEEHDLHIDEVS